MSIRITALALLALLLPSACSLVPLKMPTPITYTADQGDARTAVLNVLAGRGWVAVSDAHGVIRARLALRKHVAEVDVRYGNGQISFEHVNSSGLEEGVGTDGEAVIHKNYVSWLENLRMDLEAQLSWAALSASDG